MIGQYRGLIPENVAPKGVTTIGIYDSGDVKRASMAVPPFMRYPEGDPLYSFGVLADIHIQEDLNQTVYANEDFEYALGYLKDHGASLVCICGDIANAGFYKSSGGEKDDWQYAKYREIKDRYEDSGFQVYPITGNHDSYFRAITEDLASYQSYTGHGLYYSVIKNNDIFLFVGQPNSSTMLNTEQMTWLQEQLTTYADNRCFLFIHPYITDDSGNPFGCYGNDIFSWTPERTNFINAVKSHGNVTVFHGHSHFKLECQNEEKSSNYTNKNGFHSFHVPSTAAPAIVTFTDGQPKREQIARGSQFYLVEVFPDCIVLNGLDAQLAESGERRAQLVPQGIIKIDTAR